MSKFQIILLCFFGAFIVIAVLIFAFYKGGSATGVARIAIWSDIPQENMNLLLNTPLFTSDQTVQISYTEKSPDKISSEFTEALAEGTGPDIIILTQDNFWKDRQKLVLIPYESITERDFKSTFVEEAELFLSPQGIYALPLSMDPLVLYYNRDLLSDAGQAKPIAYWDEIYSAASNLSKRDAAGNLITSAIALGEARNIPNSKDILSLLFLQAGTPITGYIGTDLRSNLLVSPNPPVTPAEAAMDFYIQFSNPTKVFYSWNRSLMDAQTHFTSGDSAYYVGFASELNDIRNKNATLNFSVALVPQSRVSTKKITFGRLRAAAISRGTKNHLAAFGVLTKLISAESAAFLAGSLKMPPARRDILAQKPNDTFMSVFYDSSLQSKGWLDPDPNATAIIFRDAIESLTSGRSRTFEALNQADKAIGVLLK